MAQKTKTSKSKKDINEISYQEYINNLNIKYGSIPYSVTCGQLKRQKRNDGLVIHHVGEKTYPNLNKTTTNKALQRGNQLVYCNELEHIILHILICKEFLSLSVHFNQIVGMGG